MLPTPPTQDAPREPNTGRTFTQKLGIYLTGVAIGLMCFGWFQARKRMAARQQQAQQIEQAAPVQTPTNDENPG